MKFRKETVASFLVAVFALAILLGKLANPSLAQLGFQVPKVAGVLVLGLLFLRQSLMIEYHLPALPSRAPKIFNTFNLYLALALAFGRPYRSCLWGFYRLKSGTRKLWLRLSFC